MGPVVPMVSGGSAGHSDKHVAPRQPSPQRETHGHLWQPRSRTSTWPLVITWVTDINTGPSYSRTTEPGLALGGRPGQDLTMASSSPPVPHCCLVPSPAFSWCKPFGFTVSSTSPPSAPSFPHIHIAHSRITVVPTASWGRYLDGFFSGSPGPVRPGRVLGCLVHMFFFSQIIF